MTAPAPLPPLEVLEALLTYDPLTGALRWRQTRNATTTAGSEAGYVHHRGYRRVTVNGRNYPAHRIAYAMHHGHDPYPLEVDHVNRDRTDNRACNLRAVTGHQNRANGGRVDFAVRVTLPDGSTASAGSQRAAARLIGCTHSTVQRRLADGQPLQSGHRVRPA